VVELDTFPALVDGRPKLPAGLGPKHDNHHPPAVTVWFIAVEFDKAILSVRWIVSVRDGHRPSLTCSQFRELFIKGVMDMTALYLVFRCRCGSESAGQKFREIAD